MRRLAIAATMTALAASCGSGETERSRFDDDGSGGTQATTGVGGTPVTTGTGASGGDPVTTTGPGGSPVTNSSSSGMPCNDPGPEPNNNIGQATYLGAIDDCDSSELTFSGVLGDNDVDWFVYDASDDFLCAVGPDRTISADGQIRLCKYPTCVNGTPDFTCPGDTSPDMSNGLSGCCSTSQITMDLDCLGFTSDDAIIYLRIDKPGGFSCVSYSGTFHF
jgi:hypothetical protein